LAIGAGLLLRLTLGLAGLLPRLLSRLLLRLFAGATLAALTALAGLAGHSRFLTLRVCLSLRLL
jgi:hypothetical protein